MRGAPGARGSMDETRGWPENEGQRDMNGRQERVAAHARGPSARRLGTALCVLCTFGSFLVADATVTSRQSGGYPAAERQETKANQAGRAAVRDRALKSGTVRGRVSAASTGYGLRQAEIALTDASTRATFRAASDRHGRYEVLDVPPGRYVLSASKRGYVTSDYRQPTARHGRVLEVRPGELLERVDVSLPKGGVIIGRVIDETGEPVVGAVVQARRHTYRPSGRRELSVEGFLGDRGETTDDLGEFRLFGLMPGSYVVSASPDARGVVGLGGGSGARPMPTEDGYATTFAPGTPHLHEAQIVSVAADETTQVGVAMTSASIVSIAGIVHAADGQRLAKGTVSLRSADDATNGLGPVGQTFLSPTGSFLFANVVSGDYVIEVKGTGGVEAKRASAVECAAMPVSTGTQPVRVSIRTSRATAFRGRVVFEGRVPQAPVRLVAVPEDLARDHLSVAGTDSATVRADGTFHVEGVCGRVVFRALGLPQPWILKSLIVNGIEVVDAPVDATKRQATSIDVVISDKSATLTGYGKSADGEPVDDFVVLMFPTVEPSDTIPLRYMHTSRPDPNGQYRISRIPAGRYLVAAVEHVEEGGEWNPELRNRLRPLARSITVGEGELLRLDVRVVR